MQPFYQKNRKNCVKSKHVKPKTAACTKKQLVSIQLSNLFDTQTLQILSHVLFLLQNSLKN